MIIMVIVLPVILIISNNYYLHLINTLIFILTIINQGITHAITMR